MARVALLVCVVLAGACTRKNDDHCNYRGGDAFCAQMHPTRDHCSVCNADFDGCVEGVPTPECAVEGASATVADTGGQTVTSVGSAESSGGPSTTVNVTVTESSASETSVSTTDATESGGSTGEPECGDGMVNTRDEVCDGEDLNGFSCASLGLGGGELGCLPDCMAYFVDDCDNVAVCGNGAIEGNEDCDGRDLGGHTCLEMPEYSGGTLACDEFCAFNTTGCALCKEALVSCEDPAECCSGGCNGLTQSCL